MLYHPGTQTECRKNCHCLRKNLPCKRILYLESVVSSRDANRMSEKLSLFTKKFFPVREFPILEVSYHPGTQTECRKSCLCLRNKFFPVREYCILELLYHPGTLTGCRKSCFCLRENSSLLENNLSWKCCIILGRKQEVTKVVFL